MTHRRTPARSLTPICLAVVCLGAICAAPLAVRAQDYRIGSTTYYRAHTRPAFNADAAEHYAFYEWLQLSAHDVEPGLTIQASLWGRVELADIYADEERATGDVNSLLLTYQAPNKTPLDGLELRVGRQFVSAGPSMLDQLDGGFVRYRTPWGLDISGYGGAVSGIRFARQAWAVDDNDDTFGGSWAAGGRLGYTLFDKLMLGASYRHKRYDGRVAFDEVAADLATYPIDRVELLADGIYELTTTRFKQIRAGTRVTVVHGLELGGGYRYSAPDLFVPRTSIFAVFSNERFQEAYGELQWRPTRWLTLGGEGGGLIYGQACVDGPLVGSEQCEDSQVEAHAEGRADLRFGYAGKHRATVEMERQGAPEGGFWRWRVASALRLLEPLSLVIDFDWLLLDDVGAGGFESARGRSAYSIAGAGYLNWAFSERVNLTVGGRVLRSPLYSSAANMIARLTWLIDRPVHGRKSSAQTSAAAVQFSRTPAAMAIPGGTL